VARSLTDSSSFPNSSIGNPFDGKKEINRCDPIMKRKRTNGSVLELFYERVERDRFISEMEDPLDILIKKEREAKWSKRHNLSGMEKHRKGS